jgi:hypothetical protein
MCSAASQNRDYYRTSARNGPGSAKRHFVPNRVRGTNLLRKSDIPSPSRQTHHG